MPSSLLLRELQKERKRKAIRLKMQKMHRSKKQCQQSKSLPPISSQHRNGSSRDTARSSVTQPENWDKLLDTWKDNDLLFSYRSEEYATFTPRSLGASTAKSTSRSEAPPKEAVTVWHKQRKQWITVLADEREKSKLPGYLHWKKNSKQQVEKLIKPGERPRKKLRSQYMEFFSETARKNEEELTKLGGEFRWARNSSDLCKHSHAMISTNGILCKPDVVDYAYGSKCTF